MAATDQLLQLFARSIFAKLKALACVELKLTDNQSRRLRKSITEDIRTCGGLIFPDMKPPEVSKSAQEAAERIRIDISKEDWYSQSKFDPRRRIFQWEHVHTVSSIQEMCKRAGSEEEIVMILKTHLRIAWILKREDEELNGLGYRTKRPDPEGAYRHAKIELLKIQRTNQ